MGALYPLTTWIVLIAATLGDGASKYDRNGRTFYYPNSLPIATPSAAQTADGARNQFAYFMPVQSSSTSNYREQQRLFWGHGKKCRECHLLSYPYIGGPPPSSSYATVFSRPFDWTVQTSWLNAWMRPWLAWSMFPFHFLPCCPRPTPSTTVKPTTTPTTTPTPTTTKSPSTNTPTTPLPTTTTPTTELPDIPTTFDPTDEDDKLLSVIEYTEPLERVSDDNELVADELLPITKPQSIPATANHPASDSQLAAFVSSTGIQNEPTSPELKNSGVANLKSSGLSQLPQLHVVKNEEQNSATNQMVPSMTASVLLTGANEQTSTIDEGQPESFETAVNNDNQLGNIPNVLTLSNDPSKDGTIIPDDVPRLSDWDKLVTQVQQTVPLQADDSLPPDTIPAKGLNLLMKLFPPSYISFLQQ